MVLDQMVIKDVNGMIIVEMVDVHRKVTMDHHEEIHVKIQEATHVAIQELIIITTITIGIVDL